MKVIVNNKEINLNEGSNGFDLLKLVADINKNDVLVYVFNGEQYDLSTALPGEGTVSFITKFDEGAFHILNHDTAHLMAQAILSLYPHAKFGIGPAISEGYYYDIDFGDITINDQDLEKIAAKNE